MLAEKYVQGQNWGWERSDIRFAADSCDSGYWCSSLVVPKVIMNSEEEFRQRIQTERLQARFLCPAEDTVRTPD